MVNSRAIAAGIPVLQGGEDVNEVFVPVGEGSIHGLMGDVKPDQKGGPDARISWPSIGAVRPDVARTFALGVVRAADLAEAGLAEKLEAAPAAGLPRTSRAKRP